MATRLIGWDAIRFAEKNHCALSKKKDEHGPSRDDLKIEEARRIAEDTPDAIFVEFDEIPPSNVA